MATVRCELCRRHFENVRSLIAHYVDSHSKLLLAKHLIKLSLSQAIPRVLKCSDRPNNRKIKNIKGRGRQTLYSNNNLSILCSQNEIIIRDENSSVDMEFSFDEASCESKENYMTQNYLPQNNVKRTPKLRSAPKSKTNKNKLSKISTYSPSASSEDSNHMFIYNRKKVRRKKDIREKLKHYKINIMRLKQNEALNEKNGNFYICRCRDGGNRSKIVGTQQDIQENNNYIRQVKDECRRCLTSTTYNRKHIRIITSDTDSASDSSGKGFLVPYSESTFFCSKCGNGYKTEAALLEHMKIHETQCRVCNEIFPTEQAFKKHIESHIFKVFVCHVCSYEFHYKPQLRQHFECHVEDATLDLVLDMEEDYNLSGFTFANLSYAKGINSILHFLKENHDIYYYSYKFMKTICDICLSEVFFCDYERHMQTVHYSCC